MFNRALFWTDERGHRFDAHDLSDGTLRALALFAALTQPPSTRPAFITIDEPELGLHPAAISIFASLVRSASTHSQILVATQSPAVLDEFAPKAKIVHIDVDATEIGKNVAVHVPIVGDAKLALEALLRAYERLEPDAGRLAEWWSRIRGWQDAHPQRSPEPPADGCVAPETALDALGAQLGDAIITTDVGQHQMWAAQFIRFAEPRLWCTSGGLGSMGFGLPSAIGAQFARPDKLVFAIVGDGGFQMSIPELATVASYGLPVKIICMNNGYLGMVRQWQELFYNNRLSQVTLDCAYPAR